MTRVLDSISTKRTVWSRIEDEKREVRKEIAGDERKFC